MHKTISVKAKDGRPLNLFVDRLYAEAEKRIDRLEKFDLVVGKSAQLGAGDPPIEELRMTIVVTDPSEEMETDLDVILSLLKKYAAEVEVELVPKEEPTRH